MKMKAITYDRYGGPEVLRFGEQDCPVPGEGEVLLRVRAASVNALDDRRMRADPFLIRFFNGLFAPRLHALGADVAGVVDRVGPGVTRLRPGDEVFGYAPKESLGAWAEFAAIREEALAPLPAGLDFAEAAAVVLAGCTALQAVRDRAAVRPGRSVLIQGAGGGVGTFLVQLAKAYGAHVTAVCGPRSVELVESLAADRVLDYTKQDFAEEDASYDAIFGVNGSRSLKTYRDRLAPGGTYVMVGGDSRQLFEAILLGKWRFARSGKTIEVLTLDEDRHAEDLEELRSRIAAGQLRPILDRVFPLSRTAEAMRAFGRGHVRGKIVLQVP